MKLLLGLLRPSAGSAAVLGLDCSSQSREVKAIVGSTPDEPAFYDFLTGREVLDFTVEVRGLDRATAWPRIEADAAELDFTPQLDLLVGGYSLGMKKKLAVLCAVAHLPKVLLLDEPTNALDPGSAAKVRTLARRLASQGSAVLISTHLLPMAELLCDRVLLLREGKLLAEGTVADLRARAGLGAEGTLEDAFLALVG